MIGALLALDEETVVKLVFHSEELMKEHKDEWQELMDSANVAGGIDYMVFNKQSEPSQFTAPEGKRCRVFVDELDAIIFNPDLTRSFISCMKETERITGLSATRGEGFSAKEELLEKVGFEWISFDKDYPQNASQNPTFLHSNEEIVATI